MYEEFVDKFVAASQALKVGNGLESGINMGSLANPRRSQAMEVAVEDATRHGGTLRTGGHRIGDKGNFFEPTVVTELDNDAQAMNTEPFGPIAIINPFGSFDDAVTEANRLPFGLAAYAWTRSAKTANAIAAAGRDRHDVDQPRGPRHSGSAVRRRQGFGLRFRGRQRSDRAVHEPEVRDPGRPLTMSVRADSRRRVLGALAATALLPPPVASSATSPAIAATLLDGRPFDSDEKKGKVILVNFWATWCGPCRQEMPELEAYWRAHRSRGLEVLALSTDELADEPKVREAAQPFSFAVAMLKTTRLNGFGRVWRMPVSAVVGRDGSIVRRDWFVEPRLDAATLDAVILPLLG